MTIQAYIFIFLLLTTVVGLWKSAYTNEFSVSIAWCALNTGIFGCFIFVALRESSLMRRQAKKNQLTQEDYVRPLRVLEKAKS